jgi:3-hydroxyacyl-CoA dehydrogenase/enoyl-CoA hydratase/3-hydroxybutyryl-CoA epimerase
MPVSPLALCDEISLDLIYNINKQDAKDLDRPYPGSPAETLIQRMVERENRLGKKVRAGFYDYPSDGPKRLWSGLGDIAPSSDPQPNVDEVKQRLLVIQALEAIRCLEEGVVTTPDDADVGAYLGWGFAPWTGGPISYVDMVGPENFLATCRLFEKLYGPRFAPTAGLVAMAERGEPYYGNSEVGGKAA